MRHRLCNVLLILVAIASGLSLARPARAADAQEQQLAQALFDEGRRLLDEKRYSEACAKLLESQRLDPGGGTLLNLAICHEKEGKLVTARSELDEALALALKNGRKDRQQIARERIAALDASTPRVTVVVAPAGDIDGLEVKLDGIVLRRAAWGVATPVDPGSHVVEASATGRAPWSSTVQVEVAKRTTVVVPVLGPLAPLPSGGLGLSGLPRSATDSWGSRQPPMVVTDPEPEGGTLATITPPPPGKPNPVFYTVLTATLVIAATSAITGGLAFSAYGDAKAGCLPDRNYCRDQGAADAAGRASTLAWVSTVTLGVAAVGLVALLAIPSRSAAPRSPLRGSASAVPGGVSVGLSGSF